MIRSLAWRILDHPAATSFDDPGVEAMRNRLRQHNGLDSLEICEPAEAQRAARIFQRDGFVVVRDLLNEKTILLNNLQSNGATGLSG